SINASPRFNEKGEFEGMIASIEDISEIIKTEQKLIENDKLLTQQNEELAESYAHIKRINEELELAKIKAEESDKLKSAFLANMSHEIRTPMNGIVGFASLLGNPNIDNEKKSSFIELIKNSCNDLLKIVNDILDISKIESQQVELLEEQFSLNNLLEELKFHYEQVINKYEDKDIQLTISTGLSDNESIIMSDLLKVKQILCNLLDNAIKFTNQGEIKFGYELENEFFLTFYVIDTGIGIPINKQSIIFERFRQSDETLSREYGGVGLGLAICKGYIDLFGGEIWFESKENIGSAFYFTLPYITVKEPLVLTQTNTEMKTYNWSDKKILVVEDNIISAEYFEELFDETGANFTLVGNGIDAVQAIEKNQNFDVILMDIRLPDISGYEATRKIKEINKNIPVIAQTAFAMEEDLKKCLLAGCDEYISKPIDKNLLFEKIQKIFNKQ
ncbi:MAG: response regulator, partial [Bacteroidales bacterium]|nr:response regulator [Bacteroidales bacterium]